MIVKRILPTPVPMGLMIPLIVALAALGAACGPASNSPAASGLNVGQPAPPFAMTLSDGSQVTSADLDAADQPAHLFWFATW